MKTYKFDQIAINSVEKKKPTEEDKATYLGLENLDSERLEVTRFGCDVAPTGDKLLMKKGDVLFGKRRAYQKKVAIAPFDGIFSAHGMVLRPREEVVDKGFFPMFISSDYFLDAAIRISVGGLSPTINWGDLKKLEFNLPPIEKQRELADLLWSMEYTKRAYRKLITQTDELVKSRFVEIFGTVDNNSFGFKTAPLADIALDFFAGGDKPEDCSCEKDTSHPYAVFANGYENDGLQGYSSKCRVDKPAVTVSARGTIGYCFIRQPGFTPIVRLITIVPDDEVSVEYLKYAIDNIRIKSSGTSQAQLTVPNFKKEKIVIPPIVLQNQFSTFVAQADKSKFALQKSLDELTAMQKKIIEQNLT